MQTYLEILRHIFAHGKPRSNRTGVDTIGVFGHQVRFDLRKGFPLLTTKKIFFRGLAEELLWFLSGDTSVKALQDKGVHIWDEWAKPDGTIGPGYGKQWVNWTHMREVERKTFAKPDSQPIVTRMEKAVTLDLSSNKDGLVGTEWETNFGSFVVIREYRIPRSTENAFTNAAFDVQFLKTGHVAKGVIKGALAKGQVRDPYFPAFLGVACLGDVSRFDPGIVEMTRETWKGMIKRCYDKGHMAYSKYGGAGVFVDDRWLVFENFLEDLPRIEGWFMKLDHPDEFTLDKDFYATNKYSAETCIWASKEEQSINTENIRPLIATSPEGEEVIAASARDLARRFGLKRASIRNCLSGDATHHHGWTFREVETDALIRVRVYNQIRWLVSEIRHNPNSRRLVLSAWNVGDVHDMALAPCHALAQFYVQDGELSCGLYQRSCDAFLGLPWNIASYALLTHLIAHCTGLRVGELVHTFGDLHLYSNHLDQAREQLTREPYAPPQLSISADAPRDIFSFKAEHLSLSGYQHHAAISAPVAV